MLLAIVLVSSILSIASGTGIDGWVALSGSDPSLRAVDISAKGNQVWILGNDGAIHYWSVSALTPDGDWQYVDESNGGRTTPYPIAHIGATLDGCVWTADQRGNIAIYNSNAAGWTTITGGPYATWISGQYCNTAIAISNNRSTYNPSFNGTGNTIFYYANNKWTQVFNTDGSLGGSYPSAGVAASIGETSQVFSIDSNQRLYFWPAPSNSTNPSTWNEVAGAAKQVDIEDPNKVISVNPDNTMSINNGTNSLYRHPIPGGPAVKASINKSQAFYIDAGGNVYSANLTP